MSTSAAPSVDEIRERAYRLWQEEGCPEGRSVEYWLRAEADLAGSGAYGTGPGHGTGLAEAPPPPMDEPAAGVAPARRPPRRAAKGEPAAAATAAAAPDAVGGARATPVQQKRARRKAEG